MTLDFEAMAAEKLASLRANELDQTSSADSRSRYIDLHAHRFKVSLSLCKQLVAERNACVLDVGRSKFTDMLAEEFGTVWTLGFDPVKDTGGHTHAVPDARQFPHIALDLNHSNNIEMWPHPPIKFDLIVFSETIEHLTVAPECVILMLGTLLAQDGILLVTTPNATTLSKRIKLMLGRNPFEKLRLLSENPGHFREYTLEELVSMGRVCGLKPILKRYVNFQNNGRLLKMLLKNLYPSFRDSIMVVFSR
jgi:hypothetical protein